MRETILLAPGANGTELLRTLARFGNNSFGLRIMNAAELSKFAFMKSGVVTDSDFLPRKQEATVIDSFIRDITHFKSASFADSEKIAAALFSMRSLICENEFETVHTVFQNGEFMEKNKSLISVYDRYISALNADKLIDTVGLIRKAIAEAKPLDCDFIVLKEFPLSPLEDTLIKRISKSYKTAALPELFGKSAEHFKNIDYCESYGSSNEVEAVFEYILKNNIPLDKCTVATPDCGRYSQLFYDFALLHNINITFGCGLPILNSNPARLLKLIFDWNTVGFNGINALSRLLSCDALDKKKLFSTLQIGGDRELKKVAETAGALRISCDKDSNNKRIAEYKATIQNDDKKLKILSALIRLSDMLSESESKIVEKYSLIRDGFAGRIDRSALSVVCGTLDAYMRYSENKSPNEIIPEILKKSVCSENSREGALFVTGIGGSLCSVRENLFIVGMSSGSFPGTPKENYLLLDSDYMLLCDKETAPTSVNCINKNKDSLYNLLALSSALNVNTHISYSSYNLSDLKQENPSSVLFEVFKNQHGENASLEDFNNAFKSVGYFGQNVTNARYIGEAVNDGKEIVYNTLKAEDSSCAASGDNAFSPTAIDKFFSCPRRFFLTEILGVQEPDEDDPFDVITPADTGLLVHNLMAELARGSYNEEEFLNISGKAFDDFLKSRPPIHSDTALTEKNTFLRIMKNAYELDPANEVLASEERKEVRHNSGVILRGIPDRVEKNKNGEYLIADYKTGRKIKHKPDDIDTCLQVVIYAYMSEQNGIPVSYCEYRYLRDGKTVRCAYNSNIKDKLNDKLTEFKAALDSGDFPIAESEDECRYCKLKNICNRANESEKEE